MNSDEIVIEPSGKWVRIPWRDIVEYRDLLFLLVRRDFVAKYKQTVLGPVWFVLQPILYTVVFIIVFNKMAGFSTGGVPSVLFYFSGMLAWQYFSQCMGGTSTTFVANAGLFGKVYFPRLVVPLAVVISNLISYGLVLATFLVFLAYHLVSGAGGTVAPNAWVLALPLVILHTAALGLGIGLWMSALTAKYRDFAHVSGFLTQLWMFSTLPLFRDLAEIPVKYQWVLAVNPVCAIVQWYRFAFLGAGYLDPAQYGISVAVTAVLLVSGLLVFSRTERTFIDTV